MDADSFINRSKIECLRLCCEIEAAIISLASFNATWAWLQANSFTN